MNVWGSNHWPLLASMPTYLLCTYLRHTKIYMLWRQNLNNYAQHNMARSTIFFKYKVSHRQGIPLMQWHIFIILASDMHIEYSTFQTRPICQYFTTWYLQLQTTNSIHSIFYHRLSWKQGRCNSGEIKSYCYDELSITLSL